MLWSGFGETHCRHDISLSFSAATNYPSPSSASTLLLLRRTSPEAIAASTATILGFCSGACPHKSR
ncbi:unnamed protein product, partial [Musa textilis]